MAIKSKAKKVSQKSLTLNDLVKYNQEVLFPALDEKFTKIDKKFTEIDGEIREKFDKVLAGQDKILKEISDSRSENIASPDLYKKQEEKIENHEKRIMVVEKKLGIVKIK